MGRSSMLKCPSHSCVRNIWFHKNMSPPCRGRPERRRRPEGDLHAGPPRPRHRRTPLRGNHHLSAGPPLPPSSAPFLTGRLPRQASVLELRCQKLYEKVCPTPFPQPLPRSRFPKFFFCRVMEMDISCVTTQKIMNCSHFRILMGHPKRSHPAAARLFACTSGIPPLPPVPSLPPPPS